MRVSRERELIAGSRASRGYADALVLTRQR